MKLYSFITGPGDEKFCMRVLERLNTGWHTRTFEGKTPIAG